MVGEKRLYAGESAGCFLRLRLAEDGGEGRQGRFQFLLRNASGFTGEKPLRGAEGAEPVFQQGVLGGPRLELGLDLLTAADGALHHPHGIVQLLLGVRHR